MTSSNPNHLPKAPSSNNTLGVGTERQQVTWGKRTIQSTAHQRERISEVSTRQCWSWSEVSFLFLAPRPGRQSENAQRMKKELIELFSRGTWQGVSAPWERLGLPEPPWAGRGSGPPHLETHSPIELEATLYLMPSPGPLILAARHAAPTHWVPGEAILL